MRVDIEADLEIYVLAALESGATVDEIHAVIDHCVAEHRGDFDLSSDDEQAEAE